MNNHKRNSKLTLLVSLLVLLVLLLAACGGKKEKEAASTADTSAQTVAEQSNTIAGDPAKGEQIFQTACVACHGPDATGVQGLGKNLHPSENEFVSSSNDEELVEFIKKGRQPGEPGNTTGVAMPPKGGNPAISDEDLYHIVAWLRSLE